MRSEWVIACALLGMATPLSAQGVNTVEAQIGAQTRIVESPLASIDERLDAQARRGVLFRKSGRFDLAIVDFTEVLRIRPGPMTCWSSAVWR